MFIEKRLRTSGAFFCGHLQRVFWKWCRLNSKKDSGDAMFKRSLQLVVAVFLIAAPGDLSTPSHAGEMNWEKPSGGVILTISGDIQRANRGAMVKAFDGLLKRHKIDFESALELDHAMLASLPQARVRALWPSAKEASVFSGPKLRDVLRLARAKGKTIRMTALDGYAKEISVDQVAEKKWILAIERDGKPLAVGGKGPVWVMHPPSQGLAPSSKEEGTWVWALFHLGVK